MSTHNNAEKFRVLRGAHTEVVWNQRYGKAALQDTYNKASGVVEPGALPDDPNVVYDTAPVGR
jgi:hypothetical protein